MLRWLWKNKAKTMRSAASLDLNQALQAYVSTYPVPQHLQTFLDASGCPDTLRSVQASLDQALAAGIDFLYANEPVVWSAAFEQGMFNHVVQVTPWLSQEGFGRIKSYTGWMAWHEGLNAPQSHT